MANDVKVTGYRPNGDRLTLIVGTVKNAVILKPFYIGVDSVCNELAFTKLKTNLLEGPLNALKECTELRRSIDNGLSVIPLTFKVALLDV